MMMKYYGDITSLAKEFSLRGQRAVAALWFWLRDFLCWVPQPMPLLLCILLDDKHCLEVSKASETTAIHTYIHRHSYTLQSDKHAVSTQHVKSKLG